MLMLIRLLEEERYYNQMITTLKKKKNQSGSLVCEKNGVAEAELVFSFGGFFAYDTSVDSV